MTSFDLLTSVQPSEGWFAVVGIKGSGADLKRRQHLVETRQEVDQFAQQLAANGWNVFFGVAKYTDDSSRKKGNVRALKAFWLDIDCGPTKATPNPKTGRPLGYIDQTTGISELQRFCRIIGLPKPIVVSSGRGLHVYWPLTQEVTPSQWEPVAARLRDLCDTHDLIVDPVVFETARILRIPGTYNFKDNPPSPVTVLVEGNPTTFEDFTKLLGIKPPAPSPLTGTPARGLTALGQMMQDSVSKSFAKIIRRSVKNDGCEQLLDCYTSRDTLSEARWFDALSVAKFCSDRDSAIHMLSEGHPDYDPAKTEQKIAHIEGPHNCATFERNNPGLCAQCPHFGNIKNPIMLGAEVKEAQETDYAVQYVADEDTGTVEEVVIPPYPPPFFWSKTGGLWKRLADAEAAPLFVYSQHLYVVKRMYDPAVGDVIVMRLHTPRDGVKEFIVSNIKVMDKTELRKVLAAEGVVCPPKQFDLILDYIVTSISTLQHKQRAELMRMQFGWADNDSKFIIGDKEVSADGTYYSPPSEATEAIATHMHTCGSFEKWQEVFNLYGTPGLEAHAFASLTAFGAPLLKFTGQSGAVINVIHPNSGTGKTTILHMCNSVYGNPKELCSTQKDTDNARILKLGTHNNLPYCVDEITNMHPMAFSDLIYAMSNGKGKDRMEAGGNRLRVNNTKWQTISLCSSNASFYEKLGSAKATPDGEMMRMLEYKIEYTTALQVDYAKTMFDHQLMDNYGHAGPIYADWLIRNAQEASDIVRSVQAKIDAELKLTQRERFWSAVIASNIAGGLIATRYLKLMDWDMQRIFQYATGPMISSLREDVAPPITNVSAVIGDYINRHMQNILIVDDNVDLRSNVQMLPKMEPRGELLIRYEPDTKRLYISAKHFKNDCVTSQVNYKSTLDTLKKNGAFVDTGLKRLSKGMKLSTPGVHCLVFDTSVPGFLDMDDFMGIATPTPATPEVETTDAGGGS
jgi:Domain of unknown function (DUF927)